MEVRGGSDQIAASGLGARSLGFWRQTLGPALHQGPGHSNSTGASVRYKKTCTQHVRTRAAYVRAGQIRQSGIERQYIDRRVSISDVCFAGQVMRIILCTEAADVLASLRGEGMKGEMGIVLDTPHFRIRVSQTLAGGSLSTLASESCAEKARRHLSTAQVHVNVCREDTTCRDI